MALLAKIEWGARPSNTRSANRRKLSLVARGATAGQEFATVVIHDLSETGVLIETEAKLSAGERLEIDIVETGTASATVMWNSGQYYGCQFDGRLTKAAVSAAMLRNAPRPPADEPPVQAALVDSALVDSALVDAKPMNDAPVAATPAADAPPAPSPDAVGAALESADKLPVGIRIATLTALGAEAWAAVGLLGWAALTAIA
jgi:hypothetical protein